MKAFFVLTQKLLRLLGIAAYFILGSQNLANSQSIIVNSLSDANTRNQQLEGRLNSTYSLSARPYSQESLTDSLMKVDSAFKKCCVFKALPIDFHLKFNTDHPYGWNDYGMISSNGIQSIISGGVYVKNRYISLQVKPEIVISQNARYRTNTLYGSSYFKSRYKIFPGQSALRFNYKNISLGISTENLWWGPGIYNSLLMSSNAPGFTHGTFNTIRPVKTKIGFFEWQLISGVLKSNNEYGFENYFLRKPNLGNDSRYFNGLVFTYNPKWLKGFFFGVTRMFQVYNKDIKLSQTNIFNEYLPALTGLFKSNLPTEDLKRRDELLSLFSRVIFPSERLELYFEYGWNDHFENIRHFLISPSQTSAHLLGFKKIFNTAKAGNKIDMQFELTKLSPPSPNIVRAAGNWYEHYQVKHGYINDNQIIGAGIGPGNNVQTLEMRFYKKENALGFILERLEHDPVNFPVKWTDYSVGVSKITHLSKWVIEAKTQFVASDNYSWEKSKTRFNVYGIVDASWSF